LGRCSACWRLRGVDNSDAAMKAMKAFAF